MNIQTLAEKTVTTERPSRDDAENALRTILAYYGEDPTREGLLDTPKRFIDAYKEFLSGYQEDPEEILSRTFEEVDGYDDIVLLKNIKVESHCEHHIQPLIGIAHIAYLPSDRVVGISKLARVVDAYSRRLQSQETLTNQIATAIKKTLQPRGVAVLIDAAHYCMTTRGVHKDDVTCVTRCMSGAFKTDPVLEERFFRLISE